MLDPRRSLKKFLTFSCKSWTAFPSNSFLTAQNELFQPNWEMVAISNPFQVCRSVCLDIQNYLQTEVSIGKPTKPWKVRRSIFQFFFCQRVCLFATSTNTLKCYIVTFWLQVVFRDHRTSILSIIQLTMHWTKFVQPRKRDDVRQCWIALILHYLSI